MVKLDGLPNDAENSTETATGSRMQVHTVSTLDQLPTTHRRQRGSSGRSESFEVSKTPRAGKRSRDRLVSQTNSAETATVYACKSGRSVPKIKPDRPTCRHI